MLLETPDRIKKIGSKTGDRLINTLKPATLFSKFHSGIFYVNEMT